MPSDKKCNLIMAMDTELIFSLFDIASAWQVPFGIPQYVEYTHHGLTFVLLCVQTGLITGALLLLFSCNVV